MSFGSLHTPTPNPTNEPLAVANYFVTINQLSAHNAPHTQEEGAQTTPPVATGPLSMIMPYASVILFVLLFIAAFGIQLMRSIRNTKQIITAVMIALFAASIPTILTYVGEGSRQEARAGPEEVPMTVVVQREASDAVHITWKTDAMRIGVVKLGEVPFDANTAKVYVADDQQPVQLHTAIISGLKDKHRYEFEILSGKTWYDNNGTYIPFTFSSAP